MKIVIDFPFLPVSENSAYMRSVKATGRRGMFLTTRAKVNRDAIAMIAKVAMQGRKIIEQDTCDVTMVCYMKKATFSKSDITNRLKIALDALSGIVYKDDRLIRQVTCRKELAVQERTVIEVEI